MIYFLIMLFIRQWEVMKNKAKNGVNVKQLFHGTQSNYVDVICRENLDWRVCGKNGTSFGRGEFCDDHLT